MVKDNVGKKVAIGAGALALTAGAIAAGVILSDRKTRSKVVKKTRAGVKKVGELVGSMTQEEPGRYQAVTHQIRKRSKSAVNVSGSKKGKKSRGR